MGPFGKSLFIALFSLCIACASKTPEPETDPTGQGGHGGDAQQAADVPEHVAKLIANFKRVQFEFNSSDLSEESRDALNANAEILRTNTDVRVEVQGHADERGTSEYNLSLGQKRAKAVGEYLVQLGLAADRIQTISYGEEKPLEEGSGEITWSKNRRAEFRVLWGGDKAIGTTD